MGGIFPITFSLVGDYFDQKSRATAMEWRFPFIVAAVPNFLFVLIFLLVAREPKRGSKEAELADLVEQGLEYRPARGMGRR